MHPSNFDELTKALATSTSRRQALRTILGASIGGLLGIGGISTAFGRQRHRTRITAPSGPKGNSNCAKWCAQVFGPNTSAAGQCTSQAAHGTGLCRMCGTADPSSICCVRNTSGFCSGTSAARCPCDSAQCETCDTSHGTCDGCPSGQHCCSGTCKECCADSDCPSGQHCSNGQCVPDCLASGLNSLCSVNSDCCSGMCEPFGVFPPHCCSPPGTPCNLADPGGCCSGTCTAASGCA